jgi:hypothetical protein
VARCGLTLNGNIAWNYSSARLHFTNKSLKKYVPLIFEDLFQLTGNVFNSIHCADSNG